MLFRYLTTGIDSHRALLSVFLDFAPSISYAIMGVQGEEVDSGLLQGQSGLRTAVAQDIQGG